MTAESFSESGAAAMLSAGGSDYPVSSVIGLAIHRLLPAQFGAVLARFVLRIRPRIRRGAK